MTRLQFRSQIERMLGQAPFQPFLLIMVNGDRLPVFHPELIDIDPLGNGPQGTMEFAVMFDGVRGYRSFSDVAHVLPMERKGKGDKAKRD